MNIEIGDNLVLIISLIINVVLAPLVARYRINCKKLKDQLNENLSE